MRFDKEETAGLTLAALAVGTIYFAHSRIVIGEQEFFQRWGVRLSLEWFSEVSAWSLRFWRYGADRLASQIETDEKNGLLRFGALFLRCLFLVLVSPR
jgi:hypothetical protein